MFHYRHKVQYYETDKMAVVHHSNYIRWMEEARTEYLEHVGVPFTSIEALGIVSPIAEITIEYKTPCTYGDVVDIALTVDKYTGVRFEVSYEITNVETGVLLATATSKLCFVKDGKVCSLKKENAAMHEKLAQAAADPNSIE